MLIDTIRAVSALVERTLGEPPTTKDIEEGLKRPCTFVQPYNIISTSTESIRAESCKIDIIRFAEQSYKGYLSLLQAQAALADALSAPIPTQDGDYIDPGELETTINRPDMYLVISFHVQSIAIMQLEETAELMDTLQIDQNPIGG